MTWFRVDDHLPMSRKVRQIRRGKRRLAAMGAWVLAGATCAANLTDGLIDVGMLEEIGIPKDVADDLVAAGFWVETSDGYAFHDYLDWNPSRVDVEKLRAAAAERQQRARDRRAGHKGDSEERHGVTHAVTHALVTEVVTPLPTRPDPTRPSLLTEREEPPPPPSSSGGARERAPRGTRIPEPFVISDDMRTWAAGQHFAPQWVDDVTEDFADYWRAKVGPAATKLDWPATWRGWLRREAKRDLTGLSPRTFAQPGVAMDRRGPARPMSTTDERVAQGAALVEKYRALEAAASVTPIRQELTR